MKLIELLRRRSRSMDAAQIATSAAPAIFDEHFLTLKSPCWFGEYSRSPDGRWTISWKDSDPSGMRGGCRESGEGAYLLYDNAKGCVVHRGRLERPNNGHVANNGTFSIEDWHFGDALSGTLHVVRVDGKALIQRYLKANLVGNAISSNGRYAMCQTAHSSDEDGSSVFLFDVDSGAQLFSVAPQGVWPQGYSIEEEPLRLVAHVRALGDFRYDQDGNFLDAEKLERAILEKGDYSSCLMTVERALKDGGASRDRILRLLEAIRRAQVNGADGDPRWKPLALKLRGLAHDLLGDIDAAVLAYSQALALDPKIGVKRRLTSLQKARK